MFVDELLEAVEFKSSWRKERSVNSSSAQTVDLASSDKAVQAGRHKDKQVQTDDAHDHRTVAFKGDYCPDIVQFLSRVEPLVSEILTRNATSHAFDAYRQESVHSDPHSSVTCLHTLTNQALQEQDLQVTGLSWNATGDVIAVTYGRYDHEDWCTHRSALCTWNLQRRVMDTQKPDTAIDVPCCLTCIACHPINPAWIAAGNFNGEVTVWDTSQTDDMVLASSGIGDDSHREPVNKLYWIQDSDAKGKHYNLVSVSGDGKMLIWQVNVKSSSLQLHKGFFFMSESLPRRLRIRGQRSDKEVGVTCLSYNSEDSDMFVVGSESGAIFKCSMLANGTPAPSSLPSSVDLCSPVTFTYVPHHGPVYAVDCSPFHRNVFITAAMDQTLHVYNILQAQPVIVLEPGLGYIFSAKWSPVRASVFAITTESGHLLVYDVCSGKLSPVHKVQASSKQAPVYSLQFNPHRVRLLATGDSHGSVCVFELGDDLTSQSAKDLEMLTKLTSVTAE